MSGFANDGWLPIEEAPKDGTRVLLYSPDQRADDRIWVGKHTDPYWSRPGDVPLPPTHWMPLPEAPR